MATLQDSRSLLNVGTEMTGYPSTGIPVGPVNDPLNADARPSPQVPAPVIVTSLLPTGGPPATNLTLTWQVNLNVTDSLGWSNSAPSPAPQPNPNVSGYKQSWIDQWTSPYPNPADPAPDSFNIYQVVRDQYSASPTYVFVKNVAASLPGPQSTTLPLPSATVAGITEYTVTGVKAASSSYVGGEGPFPSRSTRGGLNPQYVVPKPSDIVVVTNPGNQLNLIGDSVSLQITASDTTSGTLNYTASGLPAGLSLNLTSGLITGTLTTPTGVPSAVRVSVQNMSTGAVGVQDFTWMVSPLPAPAAPTGLGSSPGTPPQTQAQLSWTAPAGTPSATGFNVYDFTGGTVTKLTSSPLSSSTLTYTVTNGVAGTTRIYYVTALNGASESIPSSVANVTYAVTAPNAPGTTASSNITTTAVDLTWSAPSGGPAPTGYNVYDTTASRPGTKLTSTPVAAPTVTYHATNGTTGTTRKYAVTALNGAVEGPQNADLSVTFA